MLTDNQKQLCKLTLKLNGEDSQLDQVQEEAIEIALAIRKYKRAKEKVHYNGPNAIIKRKKELISEIADVMIMMEQCKLIFGEEAIKKQIAFKTKRHQKRLEEKQNSLK